MTRGGDFQIIEDLFYETHSQSFVFQWVMVVASDHGIGAPFASYGIKNDEEYVVYEYMMG